MLKNIVEEEGSNDINGRKEGLKERRTDEVLVTCGKMIDELDATINAIVWLLELKLVPAGTSTIYGNSRSMSY